MAIHMPNNQFDPFARDLGTFDDLHDAATISANPTINATTHTGYMASPAQQIFHDHLRPSNLRGAEGESDVDEQNITHSPVAGANLPTMTANEQTSNNEKVKRYITETFGDPDPVSAVSEMSLNLEEMKGYAQLVFPDGEYLLTSIEIMLGRDERAQQILKEQEKRQRRLLREQALRQAQQQAAEMDAQAALERYKMEPGTGSEEGRRGSSTSSHLLEGRPAPGLASTFSETGGIVNYEGSVDDLRKKRNKRRHHLLSRSSSTTNSVAPASLHVYGAAAAPWGSNEDEKCIFLPIHPFQIEDIRKISKEHLRIFFDPVEKHWKMEIKGNGAFVLNELYKETNIDPETGEEDMAPRHFKRGDTVILTHNSEILVTSLTFQFKLPQRRGFSTFDSDAEEDLATSPTQQRTDDPDDDENDGDSELSDLDEQVKQENGTAHAETKRPKILLKASKPKPASRPEPEPDLESPEPPRVTGGKGKKKPSDAKTELEQDGTAQDPSNAQTTTPIFDANSTLQHVPVNELPEKRKGPGRPPKNGLVSKRDEGIIRRKMKEYEKRGERPPPYKDILAIVRSENRAKELAARAAARGEPVPANQLEMMNAVPTTELDQNNEAYDANNMDFTTPNTDSAMLRASSQDLESPDIMKNAQQQQRTYKSPSPMKPKEEYTEEQLKRPTQTYYYILDEILSEGPEDAMELQQIYDKICKKYPFYKYVVESTGWQSSVRHNLKQNDRFKPVSKQGKGWLWAIDPAIPLDKEKKKKPTPPPMPRPPMQYQAQHGVPYNNGYPAQYAQPYTNGQSQYSQAGIQQNVQQQTYSAPYSGSTQPYVQAPTGQTPVPPQATSSTTPVPTTAPVQQTSQPAVPRVSHPPSRPASNTPQPAAGGASGVLPPAFQDLVEEIMRFRVEYLSPYSKDPQAHSRHERIFKRCVEWISQLHMRQNPEVKFENDEERRVFQILEKMRHKFEQGGIKPALPAVQTHGAQVQAAQSPVNPSPAAQLSTNQTLSGQPDLVHPHGNHGHPAGAPQVTTAQSQPPQIPTAVAQSSMNAAQLTGQHAHPVLSSVSESPFQVAGGTRSAQAAQVVSSTTAPSMPVGGTQPSAGLQTSAQEGPPSSATVSSLAQPQMPAADLRTEVAIGIKRAASAEIIDNEHDEKRVKI